MSYKYQRRAARRRRVRSGYNTEHFLHARMRTRKMREAVSHYMKAAWDNISRNRTVFAHLRKDS